MSLTVGNWREQIAIGTIAAGAVLLATRSLKRSIEERLLKQDAPAL